MKKLRLKALDLGATELLTRERLRTILGGGSGSGGSGEACTNACGGTLGSCPDGKKCTSETCPGEPDFTHTVCV
ncbi:hypothetical protein [Chitinophaga sp.]|uniref:hypothetical protein n=1 Tax=Chitinophaga sp. TaxID=1869181 RepID=UPI002F9269FC